MKVFTEALTGHKGWKPVWREPEPKAEYDVIIIGGGGHGLATAYYLAKEHGITNVAVLEKGWIGSGNIGRNTTIIRSNYLLPGNEPFYELSMKLWENLEQDFNYNAMVSQRGVLNLLSQRCPARCLCTARQCHDHGGCRCGTAGRGRRSQNVPISRFRQCPLSDSWAALPNGAAARFAMMRLPGAMHAAQTAAVSTSSRIAK